MQLTPQEIKVIERLRKQEQRWPLVRWVLLATGIFSGICYSFILLALYSSLHVENPPSNEVLLFAMLWPKCLLGLILAGWLIVWPITNWEGSVYRMLLLRLLDAQQNQTSRDANPG